MKKSSKGFTLIELMIVVAIIGILAAIAIPNFLRYQLRSKASELATNVSAIYKSEQAIRQSERVLCAGAATGLYLSLPPTPDASKAPAAKVSSAKIVWQPADIVNATGIDWMVQGATYGTYMASIDGKPTAGGDCAAGAPFATASELGTAVTVAGTSDIDGDDTGTFIAAWQPARDGTGTVSKAAPGIATALKAAGAIGTLSDKICTDAQPTNIGDGQNINCSADNVF